MIHTSFPRVIAPYLPGYVTASLHHLHALYPTYVQYYLADSTAVPNSSEGEPIELYKLAAPLVDFVTGATRQSKARVSFDEGTLAQLVDALVQWCQMTKENVRYGCAPKCYESMNDCEFFFRKKNGQRTRMYLFRKKTTIIRRIAFELLASICSRYATPWLGITCCAWHLMLFLL